MHQKPDLPCDKQTIVSKQTTTSRKGHRDVNSLTRSCRGRWRKHRTKYQYDAVGNRLIRTNISGSLGGLGNQTFIYNGNDWLMITNLYDNNGNTTNSAGQSCQYDYENRLTGFEDSPQVNLFYDADGNRVKRTRSSVTTLYLVDTHNPSGYPQVLEEFTVGTNGVPNLSKAYTYGLALISQRNVSSSASTNFFVYDGHGSTRLLTDIGGNTVNAFAYDAFGTLIASNDIPKTAYLYGGQQLDPNLGFYYQRARWLNYGTGRFLTMDTTEGDNEDPLSLHKYLYGADDPVNNDDPSGNDYGDFDINLGSILAPLNSVLYANTSASGLNFISGLGAFAPTELVDVYTWRMPLLKMVATHRAGYVMMTLHNDTKDLPLLSQWPSTQQNTIDGKYGFIAQGIGYNSLYDFSLTTYYEQTPPSHIFEVSIPGPEVSAFNQAILKEQNTMYWASFPNPNKNETQCSTAVCYALEQAGIVPLTVSTSGLMLPSTFDLLMMNETRKPGSGVTLLKTHAFLSPAGN